MTKKITLQDRTIIEVSGNDRKNFLQGLITNDINKASDKNLIYSAMLNAQGRFLYDFFIFENNQTLVIDCLKSRRDEIITKLKMYKLRAQVEIKINDNYEILQNFEETQNLQSLEFKDPRRLEMGSRIYQNINDKAREGSDINDQSQYHYNRICLKIAESEHDLTYAKSIIAEFDFDNLNAVDYKKGCYIGQELTARTHYKGEVRKKIHHVEIENIVEIEKNSEITCQEKTIGVILSSVFYKNKLHALALIRLDENAKENAGGANYEYNSEYNFQGNKIKIIS